MSAPWSLPFPVILIKRSARAHIACNFCSRALERTWKTYRLSKGPNFALERKKAATDLTSELLQR